MKNQDRKEISEVFLGTLIKMTRYKDYPDKRKLEHQYDVFQAIMIDLTGKDKLLFNTLFARIAYFGIQHRLDRQFIYELHLYRKEKVNLQIFKNPGEVFELGLYLISRLISQFYKRIIPKEFSDIISKPFYQKNEPEIETFVFSLRGLLLDISEDKKTLNFISEEDESNEVLVHSENLELFSSAISSLNELKKSDQLPITVELRDIGVGKDKNLYPKWIILEPDYLIDVTSIAECFTPSGADARYFLLHKFLPVHPNKYLLIGHIVNSILDELIHNITVSFDEILKNVFHIAPLSLCLLEEKEVIEIVRNVHSHFFNLKRVIEKDFPELGLNAEQCVVEPSFYAPKLGIQGRLDVLYLKSANQTSIIELKSGSPFRENMYGLSVNHFTQTLLYDLMIRSVFNQKIKPLNYILYSKLDKQNLRFAPTVQAAQMEAISIRNDIYEFERRMLDKDEISKLLSLIRIEKFPLANGFLKRDIELFEEVYHSLDVLEKSYLNVMISFVAREQFLAKVGKHDTYGYGGLSDLWLKTENEKMQNFSIFSNLKIINNKSMEDPPLIELQKSASTNPLANFRVGDIVILLPYRGKSANKITDQMVRASIVAMDNDVISIKLRSKQYNQAFFKKFDKWKLESDFLDSGFRKMYQSLFQFASSPKEKRNLLLGRTAPSENKHSLAINSFDKMTLNQREILKAMLDSEQYYLLWGPPGTGKTSIMLASALENLLQETDKHVLLMAYTNRAVDEICRAIESLGDNEKVDYIRVGSKYATHPKYREKLFDQLTQNNPTREKLKNAINKIRVFVGTTASVTGKMELFQIKKFDIVIIDEASQILEPMLISLLPLFEKFILIGDHKQLPAVVVQENEHSLVEDKDLNDLAITDCRMSYFERLYVRCLSEGWTWAYGQLNEQGRMHDDIMHYINHTFYDDSLVCLPKESRLMKSLIGKFSKNNNNPLLSSRMIFVNVEGDNDYPMSKSNIAEAKITVKILQKLKSIYLESKVKMEKDEFGIITPFRAQIAQIHDVILNESENERLNDVMIDTVERYQGGARNVVIYSTVVNSINRLDQISSMDDKQHDRKLNVVVSRTREQFILVGNKTILQRNWLYKHLIQICREIDII